MILKRSELVMIRKGRHWFVTPEEPTFTAGRVIWLRSPRGEEQSRIQLQVTVGSVSLTDQGYRVVFTLGDTRPERRYIAAGWPDYTSDPFRAMRDELPPFTETPEERRERQAWTALGMRRY